MKDNLLYPVPQGAEEKAEINKYYDNEIYLARKKIRKKDEKGRKEKAGKTG